MSYFNAKDIPASTDSDWTAWQRALGQGPKLSPEQIKAHIDSLKGSDEMIEEIVSSPIDISDRALQYAEFDPLNVRTGLIATLDVAYLIACTPGSYVPITRPQTIYTTEAGYEYFRAMWLQSGFTPLPLLQWIDGVRFSIGWDFHQTPPESDRSYLFHGGAREVLVTPDSSL